MPLMVTRPGIDRIASVTRVRWRSVVASRHWLRQAKTSIMSGMGGCSSCELGLGCPYSTRSSTALPHTHFGEGIVVIDTKKGDSQTQTKARHFHRSVHSTLPRRFYAEPLF